MVKRGASEEEVKKVLEEGQEVGARGGRKAKEAVFLFNRDWRGKSYPQKKVRAVFVEEAGEVVVITVYVYYCSWEGAR